MSASIAALQMTSGDDLQHNLTRAIELMREAADQGAGLVVLPENFALFGAGKHRQTAEQLPFILNTLAEAAQSLSLWIVAGTLPCAKRPDGSLIEDGRVRPSSFVIDASGELKGRYDKIHLFDVDVADAQGSYRESATFEPGTGVEVVDTPFGKLGLTVCYDLRFPELFRALVNKGAEIITVPAAFTYVTGEAHWQTLLKARAIENLCYVIGSGQVGQHNPQRKTWGHSQIISPWGNVLAELTQAQPGVVSAHCDLNELHALRNRMPVLNHRRFDVTPSPK